MSESPYSPEVPSTDEDVKRTFDELSERVLRDSMNGLYRVKRAQGLDVLPAYEFCLRAFVAPETLPAA